MQLLSVTVLECSLYHCAWWLGSHCYYHNIFVVNHFVHSKFIFSIGPRPFRHPSLSLSLSSPPRSALLALRSAIFYLCLFICVRTLACVNILFSSHFYYIYPTLLPNAGWHSSAAYWYEIRLTYAPRNTKSIRASDQHHLRLPSPRPLPDWPSDRLSKCFYDSTAEQSTAQKSVRCTWRMSNALTNAVEFKTQT